MAASVEPWYVWEGPRHIPRLASTTTEPGGSSTKTPQNPNIHLHLLPPAYCLLDSIIEISSGGNLVAWGKFSVSYQVGVVVFIRLIQVQTLASAGSESLSKVPGYTKSSCHSLGSSRILCWDRFSRGLQGEASSVYQVQTVQDLSMWREVSPLFKIVREKWSHPRATQLSQPDLSWTAWEPDFSRAGPPGVGKVGLKHQSGLWEGWDNDNTPKPHNSVTDTS